VNLVYWQYPPNYDRLLEAFPSIRGKAGMIFTFGNDVFVPDGQPLSRELQAHESVHVKRQTTDRSAIESWWERYITDPAFRLQEELPAHRAEYREFCNNHKDGNRRIRFLHAIGERLAGPIYNGFMSSSGPRTRLSPAGARRLISEIR
jgi:hypothetical protein